MTAEGAPETAVGMAAALRAGEVSSVELVSRALERLEAWQPVTNAFSQVWASQALAWAAEADRDREGGFAGVPLAVKDLYDVEGFQTTGCSRVYAGRVAERDAPTIRNVLQPMSTRKPSCWSMSIQACTTASGVGTKNGLSTRSAASVQRPRMTAKLATARTARARLGIAVFGAR